jgi:hypothetical protein
LRRSWPLSLHAQNAPVNPSPVQESGIRAEIEGPQSGVLSVNVCSKRAKKTGLSPEPSLSRPSTKTVPRRGASGIEACYPVRKDRLISPRQGAPADRTGAHPGEETCSGRQDYVEQFAKRSNVAILLSRPKVDVSPDPLRVRGNPEMPVRT